MKNTKENILSKSLRLFAKSGYEAVSVADIAGELGITKGALYRHYENKRGIFESILERMREADFENARNFSVPEESFEENPAEYEKANLAGLKEFSLAQFIRWTEEGFDSDFRKMLTVEQYKSPEMSALFAAYLGSGPFSYVEDIFYGLGVSKSEAKDLAVKFYSPIFMFMNLYDGAKNKAEILSALKKHIEEFKI